MASIAQLLLKISGEDDGADSALDRLSRQLTRFGKQTESATADVNTSAGSAKVEALAGQLAGFGKTAQEARVDVQVEAAEAQLDRVAGRLEALARQEPSPKVTLQTANAFAQAERIEAKIAKLRATSVDVAVDVDRDRGAETAIQRIAGALSGLDGSVNTTAKTFGALGIPVSAARFALLAAIPVVAGLGSAALALVPALVSGGAALGAMSIAAGAAGAAVKVLSLGVMAQFERDAERAGTNAHTFAQSLKGAQTALIGMTRGGAEQIFTRLAPAIDAAGGKLQALRPAFTNLGAQAATAGERILAAFTTDSMIAGFSRLITAAGGAFQPLTTIAISFSRVLMTIAQAAMPLLIRTLDAAADKAKAFADGFGSVDQTQGRLQGMFGTLKQLGQILLNLGRAVVGVFKAFSVGTGGVVSGLERGSAALAAFTNGSGFRAGVQTMIGLLKEFATFAINVGRIVVGAIKLIAPAFEPIRSALQLGARALGDFVNSGEASSKLTPIFRAIGSVLGVAIEYGVDVFKRLLEAIKPAEPILRPLAAFVGGALKGAFAALKPVIDVALIAIRAIATVVGAVGTVLTPFSGLIEKLGFVVGTVFSGGIVGAVAKVLAAFGRLPGLLGPIFGAVGKTLEFFAGVMSAVGGVATRLVETAIKPFGIAFRGAGELVQIVAGSIAQVVSAAFGTVQTVTAAVWGAVKAVVSTAISAVSTVVRTHVEVVKTVVITAWNVLKTVTTTIFNAILTVISAVLGAVKTTVSAAVGVVRSVVTTAWDAIKSVTSTVWNGLKSIVSGAISAVVDLVGAGLDRVKRGFERIWNALSGVVTTAFNGVKDAVRGGVDAALGVITGFGSTFFDAGKSLIEAVGNGVISAAKAVYEKVKGAIGWIRDLLPGSEPKDSTSPLRNLARSGEAMLQNFADGIPAGAAQLRRALSSELSVVPRVAASAAGPALPGSPTSSTTSTTYNVAAPTVVGGGLPDPGHWTAALEQQLRASGGLAIQH